MHAYKYPSIGDIYLEDTFNQSIQIAFTIWDPQMASLLVMVMFGISATVAQANRYPRVANHVRGVGLGGCCQGGAPESFRVKGQYTGYCGQRYGRYSAVISSTKLGNSQMQ